MNSEQAALIKLATVRMAINHVLRTRAMQKQAYSASEGEPPVPFRDALVKDNLRGQAIDRSRMTHSKNWGYDKFQGPHLDTNDSAMDSLQYLDTYNDAPNYPGSLGYFLLSGGLRNPRDAQRNRLTKQYEMWYRPTDKQLQEGISRDKVHSIP